MLSSIRFGRVLLAFGMIALGALAVAYADFILEWTPVPAHLPARTAIAYVHGGFLIIAGLCLFFEGTVRLAALALGTMWLVWTLLHAPLVVANWRGGVGGQAETLAITSGLFLLAATSGSQTNRALALISRYAFALCLPVFGLVHFLYPAAVASWVPAWLPKHMFWAYFTGAALCAAGVALLSGVLARLASRLLAIMLSSWVLIVHIPRVVATPHDRHEWTTLFVAFVMTGIAWIVAGSLSGDLSQKRAESPREA